ncbi:MAG: glycine cleavage T C-terminal barrel domain-containing protein [Phycisphaerales bacterium]
MPPSPLQPQHERYARVESVRLAGVPVAVEWLPYGVGEGATADGLPEIVATYGLLELEYAAFRRGAAVLESAQRGTLAVRGADRVEFLNRMVTQELKGLAPGEVRAGFWLNRKGRIDADLLFCELPAAEGAPPTMLVDCDIHDAARAVQTLTSFVFSEDVTIADESAQWGRLSVHGPEAFELLRRAGVADEALEALHGPMRCARAQLAGAPVALARRDQCGSPGIELFVPAASLAAAWEALVDQHEPVDGGRRRARPAGWLAYNIARIEAGTPLFHVDFGPENLPHESGLLRERTSFRKGCYLGQEVVARMESLGKPKQMLVGLRIAGDALPLAGSPVFERGPDGEPGNPVGAVTSSTPSPMLGAAGIAFAMVRTAHAAPGTALVVPSDGERAEAVVAESLRFLPQEAAR